MAFELEDRWVWDFWLAEDHGTYHLFYLQAPRSLGNSDLRHDNASIGHATSSDLVDWEEVGTALLPGYPGEWDDVATWTGSVIEHDGRWWMFYTGRSSLEKGRVQRIGAAVSSDLNIWVKHPSNPLLSSHPYWYEHLEKRSSSVVAWRDPWVYRVDDGFEMLITARVNDGKGADRGVLARAFSSDLSVWSALPPLTKPGGFAQLEVPQRIVTTAGELLLFSCQPKNLSAERLALEKPLSDCYAIAYDGSEAPYPATDAVSLNLPNLYAARAVQDPTDRWVVLGFELEDEAGDFVGRISDPIPLEDALPSESDDE